MNRNEWTLKPIYGVLLFFIFSCVVSLMYYGAIVQLWIPSPFDFRWWKRTDWAQEFGGNGRKLVIFDVFLYGSPPPPHETLMGRLSKIMREGFSCGDNKNVFPLIWVHGFRKKYFQPLIPKWSGGTRHISPHPSPTVAAAKITSITKDDFRNFRQQDYCPILVHILSSNLFDLYTNLCI